jgi:hypothetical protein
VRILLFLAMILLATPAAAQQWGEYENARFGYIIDVPPGYAGEGEADNGDGQIFSNPDGTQVLRVFGGNALEGFGARVAEVMAGAREAGWNLSYERVTPDWASFSGTRDGIIVYARAIPLCAGRQFASFELHYPEGDVDEMHAVVERLVDSLEPTGNGLEC